VIVGGGAIGVELAQVFNTFGSQVTILEYAARILGPVDEELATLLQQTMQQQAIGIHTSCQLQSIVHSGQSVFVEYTDQSGAKQHSIADTVLMVTGRQPNVAELGLENTAVKHDLHGVEVDATLQTTEAGIYAVGDVTGQPMFAHWATAQGLALARHLLGQPISFPTPATNSENGLLKIIYQTSDHKVLGVHALIEGAGEIMGEAALLVKAGLPIETITGAIHPHPTLKQELLSIRQQLMKVCQEDNA
jgi:dihydrolipoamide dehydrogenase